MGVNAKRGKMMEWQLEKLRITKQNLKKNWIYVDTPVKALADSNTSKTPRIFNHIYISARKEKKKKWRARKKEKNNMNICSTDFF